MAHFARVVGGTVVRVHVLANPVITDDDGVEHEEWGQTFLADLHGYEPEQLIQTSYNGNFRFNYAGIGYTYDEARDAFIPPKPFESWLLNEDTCLWEAPVSRPEGDYTWDEDAGDWVEVTDETV